MPTNPLGRALRHRRAGRDTLAWARADLQAPENCTLSSPAFADGGPLPRRFRGRLVGHDVSPPLTWSTVAAAELVLVVQDPDVPFGPAATHALAVGLDPALGGLPEDGLRHPGPVAGLRHGRGPLGRRGWTGPMPVPSHGPHAYVFQLFALDRALGLPERFGLDDVLAAMPGRLVGRARLEGTYEIR